MKREIDEEVFQELINRATLCAEMVLSITSSYDIDYANDTLIFLKENNLYYK